MLRQFDGLGEINKGIGENKTEKKKRKVSVNVVIGRLSVLLWIVG